MTIEQRWRAACVACAMAVLSGVAPAPGLASGLAPGLASGLTAADEARDAATQADLDALKALMRAFTSAYEGRNLEQLMATIADTEDVTFFLPNPFVPMLIEGPVRGRAVLETFFASIPPVAIFRMSTHDDTFEVLGDVAINLNYTTIYLQIGGLSRNYTARTTNVFKRIDGSWKIVHIHGSPVPKESGYLTTARGQ